MTPITAKAAGCKERLTAIRKYESQGYECLVFRNKARATMGRLWPRQMLALTKNQGPSVQMGSEDYVWVLLPETDAEALRQFVTAHKDEIISNTSPGV